MSNNTKKIMTGLAAIGFAEVCAGFGVSLRAVANEMIAGSCDHEEATLRVAARADEVTRNISSPNSSPL